jgi:hypothetical protein
VFLIFELPITCHLLDRPQSTSTWHRLLAFHPGQINYLRTLQKGTRVYVEANYELREPTGEGEQRQIFLRHGTCHPYLK